MFRPYMRVIEGLRGGWQQRGAMHSLAQGLAHAKLASSMLAFFSSSVPESIKCYEIVFTQSDSSLR